MALPSQGVLSSDIIALEVGASTGTTHKLAGGTTPTTDSMVYWYRSGNVNTAGVNQSAPFNYSDFYAQEALYKCTRYVAGGSTGTATIVAYPGIPTNISVPANTDKNYCTRMNYDGTMAVTSNSGLTVTAGGACNGRVSSGNSAASQLGVYGMNGVRLYSTVNSDGSGTYIDWKTANDGGSYSGTYWANPNQSTAAGRLNQTGIWSGSQTYVGTGSLSFGVAVPSTGTYFVGVGSDNYIALYVDNVFQFAQTANISDVNNFRYWHIYPITLSAGTRTIRVLGTNIGSQGCMGVEVYNNTSTQISASIASAPGGSATPSGINILDSSANYKGSGVIGAFFNNTSVECPQPTMTPTPTPTLTPGAPTPTPTLTPTLTPTPTPTPTPSPTPTPGGVAYIAIYNNSLDVPITGVYINGVAVNYDSGANFNVDAGENGTFTTTAYVSGASNTIFVDYGGHIPSQNINIYDTGAGTICCTLNGSSGTCTLVSAQIDSGATVYVYVADGACF